MVERRGNALLVGLNRPDRRNALDQQMVDELHRVLSDAVAEPAILVLHSTTPGMFVSGADIGELIDRDADAALRSINASVLARLESHRWPTVAAIDGDALGAGCEMAMACDFRVASNRSRFGQPELALGILAGAGANHRLPRLVGINMARRLLYTGEMIGAETALEMGLVDWVHPPDELLDKALDIAETMAKKSWRALELTKLALELNKPQTTSFDITAQALLFESEDKRTRLQAFLDRRSR